MWPQQGGNGVKQRGDGGRDAEGELISVVRDFVVPSGVETRDGIENASEASILNGLELELGGEFGTTGHDGSFAASGLDGLGFPALRRNLGRLRTVLQGPVPNFKVYRSYVEGKEGIEIGGPSAIFRRGHPLPIYAEIGRLDHCDASSTASLVESGSAYKYATGKPAGRTYFCEGSDLREVRDGSYDAVLSAHNLEHLANPVKALKEWQRILRPGGVLVLVLPHYEDTFDHRRSPTAVEHMLNDYANDVGEDDRTHLAEILELHDLSRDKAAGTLEEFRQRSLDNVRTRCLHHHVFDEANSLELLEAVGFDVLAMDRAKPYHLCLLGRY